MSNEMTLLDVVAECDNFPYPTEPSYAHTIPHLWRFVHVSPTSVTALGYVTPPVVLAIQELPPHLSTLLSIDTSHQTISLIADTSTTRSEALSSILKHWRDHQTFSVLLGWRDERYAIYCPSGTLFASIERAAAPLFGVIAYCVYLICYTSTKSKSGESDEPELKIWVSQRSKSKQTYAGMYDVTVAGAMVDTDSSALECMVREAGEEASLSEDVVKERAREIGRVNYFGVSDGLEEHAGGERGLCCPEVGTVFEMYVEEGRGMRPGDGEVLGFELRSVDEVKGMLRRGMFKGNSGAVLVDWLRGRGLLNEERDSEVLEVERRMRRELEFPIM
ncbi:thiamine pyrophosphokinase-related protein-like protein [Rhexocercosporidium sp. MPI-PUGE-AT-0058]|nr:thiamine pyrophosphokinase-related protein-like protein [Rhexocercosporidium sp. MPI-PUGE-AT-0058]